MINDSLLPHFPKNLGDIFAKSWITYKALWFVFFGFIFVFHAPAALLFLIFKKPENLPFIIHFTDFSRFYISKMGDAFACFLLPLFLKNQLPSFHQLLKTFFSKYFAKLSLVVLLLYFLKTQFLISGASSTLTIFLLGIGLTCAYFFLFVTFFVVIDTGNNFFEYFKASFLLCQLHVKKILFYFLTAFIFVKAIGFFLLMIFVSQTTNLLVPNSDDIEKLLDNLLKVMLSTEFYLVNSFLHILLQPFLSIFLCILFYSLLARNTADYSKALH